MNEQTKVTVTATGAMAELAHTFFKSMIDCGASKEEAIEGMRAFISALFLSGKNNQGGAT